MVVRVLAIFTFTRLFGNLRLSFPQHNNPGKAPQTAGNRERIGPGLGVVGRISATLLVAYEAFARDCPPMLREVELAIHSAINLRRYG